MYKESCNLVLQPHPLPPLQIYTIAVHVSMWGKWAWRERKRKAAAARNSYNCYEVFEVHYSLAHVTV